MSYQCSPLGFEACGRHFTSLRGFDKHLQSFATQPGKPEKSARCRTDQELHELGYERHMETGKWFSAEDRDEARATFKASAQKVKP